MLALRFEEPHSGDVYSVPPAPAFHFQGGSLRRGPRGQEVAVYREGAWHVGDRAFTHILIDSPALIHFEGHGAPCSDRHGPFEKLRLIDGTIRHGPRFGRLLARFDEGSQAWDVYPDRTQCPTAVIEAG